MRIIQVGLVLLFVLYEIEGENRKRLTRSTCFCAETECCSKWGFCGKTDAYCGKGCQSGPCKISPLAKQAATFNITSEMFACIFPTIDADLRAQRFKGLIEAMEQMKWKPLNSTEAAVFLSHVSHETDGLKTLVEYCAKQGSKYHLCSSSLLELIVF
jgi:chitinase